LFGYYRLIGLSIEIDFMIMELMFIRHVAEYESPVYISDNWFNEYNQVKIGHFYLSLSIYQTPLTARFINDGKNFTGVPIKC